MFITAVRLSKHMLPLNEQRSSISVNALQTKASLARFILKANREIIEKLLVFSSRNKCIHVCQETK